MLAEYISDTAAPSRTLIWGGGGEGREMKPFPGFVISISKTFVLWMNDGAAAVDGVYYDHVYQYSSNNTHHHVIHCRR